MNLPLNSAARKNFKTRAFYRENRHIINDLKKTTGKIPTMDEITAYCLKMKGLIK